MLKPQPNLLRLPVNAEPETGPMSDNKHPLRVLAESGPLFPGLARRASKGGKIGARIGELFRKKLGS